MSWRPGPGHSSADRSLSVKIDPAAPDGFVVHSFSGDDPRECRDHVRAALGPSRWVPPRRISKRRSPPTPLVSAADTSEDRWAYAWRLWDEARDPRGTIVSDYLASRSLTLPNEIACDVFRFHPSLAYDDRRVAGMLALFRDIRTNEPCGLHRTFLDEAARKIDRRMLGRARGAAIKLDADENVTLGLHIGEGVETCFAGWLAGFRPVWALGSVGAIAKFPVLSGIESITVFGETGDGGANRRAALACGECWVEAGREALLVEPQVGGDLNDVWREVTL